jgi:hypothetical protein
MGAERASSRVRSRLDLGEIVESRDGAFFGLAIAVAVGIVYSLCGTSFTAGRPDLFFLADAFLHGRTWLPYEFGPYDIVKIGNEIFVPFGPFPAIVLMPLVALVGPITATHLEPAVNGTLGGIDVLLCWIALQRWGAKDLRDRMWLTLLFAFSTVTWSIATRGGVWHTGHLVGMMMAFGALIEMRGARRPWLIGLLIGAAFLSRAPIVFAAPVMALWLLPHPLELRRNAGKIARRWVSLGAGLAPAGLFFLWYNWVRFGTPLESGYAIAALPAFLEAQRAEGLFSIRHIPMNLNYLFLHLPKVIEKPPYLWPDGMGMSIFITSPGLFFGARVDWRRWDTLFLGGMVLATLLPNLLYYGGGWYQFGFRYGLDSVPFAMALCGVAASRHPLSSRWRLVILFGILVGAFGAWWSTQ